MINIILISVALAILTIGTYTDFKTREVPDWVNYSGIAAGLGIRLLYSASTFDWSYIISGAIGFGVFLAIALAMFYLGQWGGGDSKMLMGIGALLGIEMRPDNITIAFFVNALIVGAAYGVLWSIVLAIRHRKKFLPYVAKLIKTKSYKNAKKALFLIVIGIAAFSFAVEYPLNAMLIAVGFAILFMFFAFILLSAVEKTSLVKSVSAEKLTEGDWIVKDVMVGGKRICGPKDLGISKPQIRKLLKLKENGKVKKVLIKEGMPFVPVFFIAFLVAVFAGNIVLLFI